MKKIILCILISFQFYAYAQSQSSLDLFLNSFPSIENKEIVTFESIILDKQNTIDKINALLYIYGGDTSRLICRGVYINMESNEITGQYTDTILPYKIGKINIDKTIFAFYTTHNCQNERDFWWTNGEVAIYENGVLQDKCTIYRANEYEAEINSILNTTNNMLFIQLLNKEKKIEYKLLRLSKNKPYITEVKSIKQSKSIGNLLKVLETLGWKELFELEY